MLTRVNRGTGEVFNCGYRVRRYLLKIVLVSNNNGLRGDSVKRIFVLMLLSFLGIVLIGCSSSDITGYVMDKEDDRILVVSTSVQGKHYPAMWLGNGPQDIQIGDKIDVWYDTDYDISDSYPGGAAAGRVEKIVNNKPRGAYLTESEALYKSLSSDELGAVGYTTVMSVEYDNDSNRWHIELKEIVGEKELEIKVDG